MIFDRTANDVESARQIISQKVQKFIELSSEEVEKLERGCVTINTLNRIENAEKELGELLYAMRYCVFNLSNREWTYEDIFDDNNLSRIVENLTLIKNAFFVYSDTTTTPSKRYHYENFNAIEKNIVEILSIIDDVKSKYMQCGEFQCGEVNNK